MARESLKQTQLDDAIERVYQAFARYPRPQRVEGCPCCVTSAHEERLRSHPLRKLPAESLTRYAFKALSTWGGVDDLRHYLPRILELVVTQQMNGINPQTVFGKLELGGWTEWPAPQRDAIDALLSAWWTGAVLRADESVVEVLASVLRTGRPLDELLAIARVHAQSDAGARASLLAIAVALGRNRTLDAWVTPETSDAAAEWLGAHARPLLERALAEDADPATRDMSGWALDALWLRIG